MSQRAEWSVVTASIIQQPHLSSNPALPFIIISCFDYRGVSMQTSQRAVYPRRVVTTSRASSMLQYSPLMLQQSASCRAPIQHVQSQRS